MRSANPVPTTDRTGTDGLVLKSGVGLARRSHALCDERPALLPCSEYTTPEKRTCGRHYRSFSPQLGTLQRTWRDECLHLRPARAGSAFQTAERRTLCRVAAHSRRFFFSELDCVDAQHSRNMQHSVNAVDFPPKPSRRCLLREQCCLPGGWRQSKVRPFARRPRSGLR